MRYLPENIVHLDTLIAAYMQETLPTTDSVTFLDEPYTAVFARLYRLYTLMTFDDQLDEFLSGWFVNEYDEVDTDDLISFFQSIRFLNAIFYDRVNSVYESVQALENEIVSRGLLLGDMVRTVIDTMGQVKAGISREANMRSISDEVIIYDTFTGKTVFSPADSNPAAVDTVTGFISLLPQSVTPVGCLIKEAMVPGVPKGGIREQVFGVDTFSTIDNGYFHGRTFSATPRINDVRASQLSALSDGNMTTAYECELNTSAILSDGFSVVIDAEPLSECNLINLSMMVPTTESTVASPSYQVFVPLLRGSKTNSALTLFDNQIITDKLTVGRVEPLWEYGERSAVVKTYTVPLVRANETVRIQFTTYTPQLAAFPEIVFLNSASREVFRLNYFETLAVRGYEAPEGTLNPLSLFTRDQLSQLVSKISQSEFTVHTALSTLYRYYIGIKELSFSHATYTTRGEAVSSNINHRQQTLVSVDLAASEHIPEGTAIEYAISTDRTTWTPLVPINANRSGARRAVFSSQLPTAQGDIRVSPSSNNLYVKIALQGNGVVTPVVRSIVVRMKVETD